MRFSGNGGQNLVREHIFRDGNRERFCNYRSSLLVAIAVSRRTLIVTFSVSIRSGCDPVSMFAQALYHFRLNPLAVFGRLDGAAALPLSMAGIRPFRTITVAQSGARGVIEFCGNRIAGTRSAEELTQRVSVCCAPWANPLRRLNSQISGHSAEVPPVPARKSAPRFSRRHRNSESPRVHFHFYVP